MQLCYGDDMVMSESSVSRIISMTLDRIFFLDITAQNCNRIPHAYQNQEHVSNSRVPQSNVIKQEEIYIFYGEHIKMYDDFPNYFPL